MPVHINALEIENIKRIQAVALEPAPSGLTVIGGRNNQGKTSVLDAIAWALGGDRYRPDNYARTGASAPPRLKVTLSNGIIVERKGKHADLKVTDPTGQRAGQRLLDSFVEELALNLPKFMAASDKEKADTLLRIIGVSDQLHELEQQEQQLYNQRHYAGQQRDQKAKYAAELPFVPGAPEEEISASELIRRQQDILLRNAENQRKRQKRDQLQQERDALREQINLLQEQLQQTEDDLAIAVQAAEGLQDESTAALEADIQHIDQLNQSARINADKKRAEQDAQLLDFQYRKLTEEIAQVRKARQALLEWADLPLPGLSVEDGKLLYQGQPWDNLSGSDQLRVATAIVRRLNPQCSFVLLDKLEQMDLDTLREFGAWLESEGLQAIATRVSTGPECTLIIEDGMAVQPAPASPAPTWQKGVF